MKKGAADFILTLLLGIAAFVVILWLTAFIWYPAVNEKVQDYICELSIISRSYIKNPIGKVPVARVFVGGESPVKIRCKTHYKSLDTEDRDKIMKVMAEEAKNCWDRFGEGKFDFYNDRVSAFGTRDDCFL